MSASTIKRHRVVGLGWVTAAAVVGCSSADPAASTSAGESGSSTSSTSGAGGSVSACSIPTGDPNWTRVCWVTERDCDAEVATDPKAAVSSLAWVSCPDGSPPGCTKIDPTWVTPPANSDWSRGGVSPPSVLRTSRGYLIGLVMSRPFQPDESERAIVFDEAGEPTAAWRFVLTGSGGGCSPMTPLVLEKRTWVAAEYVSPTASTRSFYVEASLDRLADVKQAIPESLFSQQEAASDVALALQPLGGRVTRIYDRLTDKSEDLGSSDRYVTMAHPIRESALLLSSTDGKRFEGWVWTHGKAGMRRLLGSSSKSVVNLRSDGDTLVWVEASIPTKPFDTSPPGDLWTAPFVTESEAVVAEKRRALPAVVGIDGAATAGGGYYALGAKNRIDIYRLSDAHHWSFAPAAPEDAVSYVDDKYVFYRAESNVYRQELAALGDGD